VIRQLYDDFKASLPPVLAAFPHYFGRLALGENASYPRVVWVPGSGDRFMPGSGGRDGAGLPYKSLQTRQASVELHIWGADDDTAEVMMESYLALLLVTYGTAACQVSHGYFLTEQHEAAYEHDGSVYVLSIAIDQPIIKPATWGVLETIASDCPCEDC
jgi:hypothetical protein